MSSDQKHENQIGHMAYCQEIAAKVTAYCDDIRQRFPGHEAYVDEAQRMIVDALNRGMPEQARAIAILSFIREKAMIRTCFPEVTSDGEGQP